MAKLNQDIDMYIDSHQELTFTMEDGTDLTGYTVLWAMGETRHGDRIIEKTSAIGTEIAINGTTFMVYITPTDNSDLEEKTYYHEARIIDGTGKTRPVAIGNVKVINTLTTSTV